MTTGFSQNALTKWDKKQRNKQTKQNLSLIYIFVYEILTHEHVLLLKPASLRGPDMTTSYQLMSHRDNGDSCLNERFTDKQKALV